MTEYEIACLGKTRFTTRRFAKAAANRIRRNGGPALRPYECGYWDHWHLGHRPGHATYLRDTPRGPIPVQEYAA
ncbi:hypothetical protein OG298_45295 (plasmid) [Streptomyces sp. NBC_01005]|uniref:hypothetical protein n=1 Tax=Streptomyces sp. NBC_01005 TaxID=2903715 RepID=UPI00386CC904|nr:hypothetical protein OG298_45295 [Streptomyces sp. NBC_01005]